MHNDRAGIGSILLPFPPINTTQKEHIREEKRKEMKEGEQGKKTGKFETGGI
jgi:hypothetical protein